MSGKQYTVEMPDGGSLVLKISDSNTYSINSGYFRITNKSFKCAIDGFYEDFSYKYDLDFNNDPDTYEGFGYFLKHLSVNTQFDKANFGVIRREEDNSLWCVFVPIYEKGKIKEQTAKVTEDFQLPIKNSNHIAPIVFFCKLNSSSKKNGNWYSFLQWLPNWGPSGEEKDFGKSTIEYFDKVLEKSISSHQLFGSYGTSPLSYLPHINFENTFPIYCFKHINNTAKLCSFLLGETDKNPNFIVSFKSTSSNNSSIDLFSSQKSNLKLFSKRSWIYKGRQSPIFESNELSDFYDCINNIELHEKSTGETFVFEIQLDGIPAKAYTFVNGSIQFNARNKESTEKNPKLIFKLFGSYVKETIDFNPEFIITNLPCTFSYSPLTDLASQNRNAVFDTNSLKEDQLHRESSVVLSDFATKDTTKDTTLNIRIKTQKDRNAIVEWSINAKPAKSDLESKPKALYFQAKPFSVAQIEFPDHEPEGGEKIAFWRSDDTEGAQWRIADSEMTVYLPPQAVGEEMERGKRFWPDGKPYIGEGENKDKPVRYRFSPPTKLSVTPGTKVRRYNAVPNNLQLVLKESVVKEFDTEIVYPINTKFKVNGEGLPHIRVSETAFFTGKPTENLPPYRPDDLLDLYRDVLADEIAIYTSEKSGLFEKDPDKKEKNPYSDFKTKFGDSYKLTRLAHSAVRANWVSRIAQYHLYDPYRADGKLMLSQGLEFKIRDVNDGAAPLISPLPIGIDLTSDDLKKLETYVKRIKGDAKNGFIEQTEAKGYGALRAGVIYTIEFASVLLAVLTNNKNDKGQAISEEGIIEELSFTPLGANGYISVAFDEGRTIFKARVHHGQISRLENIRIGRLGVLWNKARHVTVYERTTVPSEQFKDEQGNDGDSSFMGWPIIRKTEEYVEPIEIKRKFETESSKEINACGFIESSEFISQKIYVNSAWGKNYEHGYEIPLWSADESNSVYVKPTLVLNAYTGSAETNKQILDEPQHLYFYSNTQLGTGKDSDNWQPQIEIDLPRGLCRLPVITGAHLKDDSQKIISTKEMPRPNASESARRPRFDLAVKSAGPVNLQHKRGDTQMLAAMQVISLARTGEAAPSKEIEKLIKDVIVKSKDISEALDAFNSTQNAVKSFFADVEKDFVNKIKSAESINCNDIKQELENKKNNFLTNCKNELDKSSGDISKKLTDVIHKYLSDDVIELLEIKIDYPADYLTKYVSQLAKTAFDDLKELEDKTQQDLESEFESVKQQVDKNLRPIIKFLESAEYELSKPLHGINDLEINKYEIPQIPPIIHENINGILEHYIDSLTKQYLDGLRVDKGKNKLLDLVIALIERFVLAQISFLKSAVESDIKADSDVFKNLNAKIVEINKLISQLISGVTALKDKLNVSLKKTKSIITEDINKLNQFVKLTEAEVSSELQKIFKFLGENIDDAEDSLLKSAVSVDKEIANNNSCLNNPKEDIIGSLNNLENSIVTNVVNLEKQFIEFSDNAFAIVNSDLIKLIDQLGDQCNEAKDKLNTFLTDVNKRLSESKEQLGAFVEQYIDKNTQQQIQELAQQYEAKAESGIKLYKAIGELPKLPTLDFNALAAEYVFGDIDKAISTSPYAVKLKEAGDALNGLGLTLPSSSMLDQFVPSSLDGLNFRDVFNNMGGIDFKHLFEKFKLDDKLKSENIIVTHELDKATRQAWVKAEVKANLPEKQSLFEVSGIGVSTTNLKLNAISEQRIDLQGKRQSINNGKFISDFSLDFSGNKLAVFKEVTISFDNGKFDFDISPDKIELHPSIKFVSEIAKQIQGSLPPYIEVVKDDKGKTKGVRSSMNIEVANPPDFGAVKIGTLILYSGIQLEMTDNGQFQISSFLSVGKKETPIFLQIGELGGGMWLETTATQIGPNTRVNASLGLAVGNTRRKNIGRVANGEYSIMLFAYADYQIENGRTASQFRAGISVYGSARVLSIANATIFMLLEAIHDSQNGSKGVGILDVSISMGRFYKIKIKKQVEQSI